MQTSTRTRNRRVGYGAGYTIQYISTGERFNICLTWFTVIGAISSRAPVIAGTAITEWSHLSFDLALLQDIFQRICAENIQKMIDSGITNSELIVRLGSEIEYSGEVESTKEPTWLKTFKANQTFTVQHFSYPIFIKSSQINDVPGSDEVTLTRTFGSKKVRTAMSTVSTGKGGMGIDSTTDGVSFEIDHVSFYGDEHLALDESSENDWNNYSTM
ncbi:uncharacterized protein MELLADRAFT_111124 [Melampsora larici-populina 98AG31]|uniref:Uncharacterized protein n=1 Tax=Melampsora larici-populina (strain 98AG31 / pathotype 3-4-7) TaxID=747676 RepID=F4S240_MELLP|nr:uncharacterized protein MELLADRAFT_111124 [Melampsora larici-populina 98AG31]EGG01327.1 hypothetical protein MELLADRAFT_111124 [Melampsora larici-populina 98AG31]